jgi:O-antigen/teichoic acid export membrane protein
MIDHEYQWRKWIKGSLPLLFVSASYRVLRHIDILLIAAFLNKECAGVYAVAVAMNAWILFPLIAGNAIGGPLYATLIAKNDVHELDRLMTGYTLWVFIPSLLIAILLAFSAPLILSFFGTSFSSAYLPFLIVAAGELINVGTGAVGWILQVSGNERTCAIGFVGAALLNISLAVFLIPIFGMEGAAIATALANIARNIFMLRIVRNGLLLDPSLFGTIRRLVKKELNPL